MSFSRFQSTPPRGGRPYAQQHPALSVGISIHAPREGGDDDVSHLIHSLVIISIHAPREGGDSSRTFCYPTKYEIISIHAPREGGGIIVICYLIGMIVFQSTPPARGGDEYEWDGTEVSNDFNPRPPARGATL